MIFNATTITHTTPAISVQVADSSGVTYSQVKQSLGNQVYNVQGLYLYSDNIRQLIGTIQYQIFDSTGSQNITSIATTVNPYQNVNALLIDIKDKINAPVILNGNSSISTSIHPQTYFQVKFLSSRVTNAFGQSLSNFKDMQRITNTKFFENYGNPVDDIQVTKKDVVNRIQKNFDSSPTFSENNTIKININNIVVTVASVVVLSAGAYFIFNNTKYLPNVFGRT